MSNSKTRRNRLSTTRKTKTHTRKNRNVGGTDPFTLGASIGSLYPLYYGVFKDYTEGANRIWENLHSDNCRHFDRCFLCKNELPSDMEYISRSAVGRLGAGMTTKATTKQKIIMRSYPLSTGNRYWTSSTMFLNVQPTIYYFHCPHCAYFYQFKGDIIKNRGNMNRRPHSYSDSDRRRDRDERGDRGKSERGNRDKSERGRYRSIRDSERENNSRYSRSDSQSRRSKR